MADRFISLTQFLIEEDRRSGTVPANLKQLIEVVAQACKSIGTAVGKGALGGVLGVQGDVNVQGEIQKKLEADGFEEVGGEFTYIPNDLKDVTPEQRETINKMVERLEEFDDVQTVYTNMKPEE